MASCFTSLLQLLNDELKNKPEELLVHILRDKGSVESLTELKIVFAKEAHNFVHNFLKGERVHSICLWTGWLGM